MGSDWREAPREFPADMRGLARPGEPGPVEMLERVPHIAVFKAQGSGWQSRINDALRKAARL